jgi:hypothetical protein
MQLCIAARSKKMLAVLPALALALPATAAWAGGADTNAAPVPDLPSATAAPSPPGAPALPHTPPLPGRPWGSPGGPDGPGLPYVPAATHTPAPTLER